MSGVGRGIQTLEDLKRVAEDYSTNGDLVVFVPMMDELFLDIDTPLKAGEPIIPPALGEAIDEGYGFYSMCMTTSQGGNRHIYIKLGCAITEGERIALQAALGSDPLKEILSLRQLACNSPVSTALFELPDQAEIVNNWRERPAVKDKL